MHPDDDTMDAYEPYRGPERRVSAKAEAEARDEIKLHLEALTLDVGWIKKGLAWGLTAAGAVISVSLGLVITYTVSTHADIDKLQEQVAKIETLSRSHHNDNGCHFLGPK